MRILITNVELETRSGTPLYVRDLALELRRTGHEPVVYTKKVGAIAHELEKQGVPVITRLHKVRATPDVIHCHHTIPARDALRRFPRTPAISVCHDHTSFYDRVIIDPQIRRYFGVSRLCVARLVSAGLAPERAELLPNFVDTRRFIARVALPATPKRALVFSNYARRGTHLPAVADACRQAGLDLDVIGEGVGNPCAAPEWVLGRYDIVFAKARAAMEAIATGAAVVLCDFGGVGPAVTSENFWPLRAMNFGFESLVDPLTAESVLRQIDHYDPLDAARVGAKLRSVANLRDAVGNLCAIYSEVASGHGYEYGHRKGAARHLPSRSSRDSRVEMVRCVAHLMWLRLPASSRALLKRMPGVSSLLPILRDKL
jgi:hypothetical protein